MEHRARPAASFRPPYLAIDGLSERTILFTALACSAILMSANDFLPLTFARPRLSLAETALLTVAQLVFAAACSWMQTIELALIALGIWAFADLIFHVVTPEWAGVTLIVHVFQAAQIQNVVSRRRRSHEEQDRLVLRCAALLAPITSYFSVKLALGVSDANLAFAFVPFAATIVLGVLATWRAVARRAWVASLRGRGSARWTILPLRPADTGLAPIVDFPRRADAVIVAMGEEEPTYRAPTERKPIALLSLTHAPTKLGAGPSWFAMIVTAILTLLTLATFAGMK